MDIEKGRLLWDPTDPPSVRQATSEAAAKSVKSKVPVQEYRILYYLRSRELSGATDEEIQSALGMPGNTERPRRIGLLKKGDIFQSADRRKTKSGKSAIVWCISAEGYRKVRL